MNLNYMRKLILVAVVLVVGIGYANANPITNSLTTSIAQNSDNWVLINSNGEIKVFLMETSGTDGVTLLKIKFENTSNQLINFNWSIDKESESLFKDVSNRLEPLGFIEIDPVKILIPINREESYKDFSIMINIK